METGVETSDSSGAEDEEEVVHGGGGEDGGGLEGERGQGGADSDSESVDSEQEDLLKHAGIYTPEEVRRGTVLF